MYALEMLLVSWGILAFRRALESPTLGRLVQFGADRRAAALHAVLDAVPAARRRRAARRARVARRVPRTRRAGCCSRWWSPASRSSRGCRRSCTSARTPARRGGPRSSRACRSATRCATSRAATSRRAGSCSSRCSGCCCSACSARATDDRRIELDLHTQPGARWEAIVGGATLVVGLTLNYVAGGAFQSRYSALVFPFFVVLVARGVTTLADPRVRAGVLVVVLGLGFVGGVPQRRRRTAPQAGRGRRACCAPKRSPATSSCTAPTSSARRCTGSRPPGSTR